MNNNSKTTANDDLFYSKPMPNFCTDCGFTKICTQQEFMSHMSLHSELDDICEELGLEQDRLRIDFSFTGEGDD